MSVGRGFPVHGLLGQTRGSAGLICSSSFFRPTRGGRQLRAGSSERVSVAERVLDMSVVITRCCGQSRGSDRARATVPCAKKPTLSPLCGAHFSPKGFRVSGSIPSGHFGPLWGFSSYRTIRRVLVPQVKERLGRSKLVGV